tara:strand:+ start:1417 stop:4893 length:3477 start_codon:yes stop_codon:yes gene_type:complete
MAHVLLDRAKVVATSMSGNTSNYTLTNTPETGFVDFTGVGDGNTTYYAAIDNAGNFEIGIGTFATSGEVLTRTDGNVIKSTNSNNRVSWPSNSTPTVFITQPADKAVFTDANGDATLKTSDGAILNLQTSDTTINSGDILGAINFQAPDESSGGDAIEIAAVIEAKATNSFKSDVIETDLIFKVANDAAATERMRLTKSGALKLSSTTNEDNLVIQTTFGSETNSTPDLSLYNNSTIAGTDNALGVLKYQANTANHSHHTFADVVGMAFSTTQNALEGGIRFRFAEGSSHSWGANEYLSFRPEKIQYYNGTSTTTLAFTTPTAGDVTLTLPNTTGTIALTSDGVAADDISTGDAAVTIGTSSGDITLDTDGDIILDANNASADGGGIFFKDNNNIFGHFVSDDFYGNSYLTTDFELRSTNTGTLAGPILNLWRNSNSPAVNDDIGQVNFIGEDSASNKQAYAGITGEIINPTHGNEEAQIYFIIANGDNSVTNGYTTTYKFGASRLLLDGTTQLQFGDNGTYIHQSADGVLDLVADTELELNGGIVDINSSVGDINIGAVGGNTIISGDTGAMTLTNSGTGNITIDSSGNDTDIIFKGTDNNADITMLTLDGSAAGNATFNSNLGVGTSPSSLWVGQVSANVNAIDVSGKSGFYAYTGSSGTDGETTISTNAYFATNGWKAKQTGEASAYSAKQDGTHTFYGTKGTSSTINTNITFNELFKITSDGAEIYGNTAGGYLQLNCENNSHGVKLQSPDHSAAQSYTLKLPDNQVAVNKILKVKSISGSGATAIGQLEFADDASGGGGSSAADDITTGDAEVTIATSFGHIIIDNQASDQDIIFYGTDGGSHITALRLDMSDNGKAIFSDDIQVGKDVFLESLGTGTKPKLDLYWKKLSTTQSIGQINFRAYRTPGINRTFATIDAYSPNNSNGSELGSLKFGLTIGNTTSTRAELTATSASGGIFRLHQGFDLAFRGQSGSAGYTTLTVTNPTQNNTITLPDATGTVALTSDITGGGGVTVQDEGGALSTTGTTLNFVGAGVVASGTGATKTITIAGGGSGVTVQDEGSSLSTAGTTLDFVGAGVVASGTGATKTITIAGGGSGITVQDEGSALSTAGTTLNFVGAGVTASGTGATKTVTISGGGGGITTGKAIAMAMVFG